MYSKMSQLLRCLGHLSAVYCVLFDRSGNYIITVSSDTSSSVSSLLHIIVIACHHCALSSSSDEVDHCFLSKCLGEFHIICA